MKNPIAYVVCARRYSLLKFLNLQISKTFLLQRKARSQTGERASGLLSSRVGLQPTIQITTVIESF
jgi:hypothetical protein